MSRNSWATRLSPYKRLLPYAAHTKCRGGNLAARIMCVLRTTSAMTDGNYTIANITDLLRKVACSNIDQTHWLFDYTDEITDDMNTVCFILAIRYDLGH